MELYGLRSNELFALVKLYGTVIELEVLLISTSGSMNLVQHPVIVVGSLEGSVGKK